jgi:hypothetical protein
MVRRRELRLGLGVGSPERNFMYRIALIASLLVATPLAHADAPPAEPEQFIMPKGAIVLNGFLEVNLSDSRVGKPISLTPDAWYGATDELTVGFIHSTVGQTGFLGGVGDSLCLTGSGDGGCIDFYRGLGIDGRYKLPQAPLSADAGLYINSLDPFALGLKLGGVGGWRFGKAAVEVQPNLFFTVVGRDDVPLKDTLFLPATGSYEVAPKIEVAAQLGLVLPFENTGDLWAIPLSLAARYQIDEHLSAGIVLSLPALLGGSAQLNGIDARTLTLGGTYAL